MSRPSPTASGCWAPTTPTPWHRGTTSRSPTGRRGARSRRSPLHEQALADSERLLGTDHPRTLASRNNLAAAYEEAGRTAEATALHEQALADSERVLGPTTPTP